MENFKIFFLSTVGLILLLSFQVEAQEKPYKEGSVWDISLIKTKAPYFNDYMNNLNDGWKKVMDEAKKEGIVLSYMVLAQNPRTTNDWDLALLIEYKNMAAFDGLNDKIEKIQSKLFGSQKGIQDAAVKETKLENYLEVD